MIGSRTGRISQKLEDMRQHSPEVEAVALISMEGLLLAQSVPADIDAERLAAMAAAMLALGERVAEELARGELERVSMQGELGHVIVQAVNEKAVLAACSAEDATLGMLLLDIQRTALALRQFL